VTRRRETLLEAADRIAVARGEPTSDAEAYRQEGRESAAETLREMADEVDVRGGADRGPCPHVWGATWTGPTGRWWADCAICGERKRGEASRP